jgi:hypothetical protein
LPEFASLPSFFEPRRLSQRHNSMSSRQPYRSHTRRLGQI